jgi:predicted negative regulator of RcsB-dependent stress response
MAYNLEEQEQIAHLKAWWDKYGNFLLTLATLVLLGVAAFNGWRWYERREGLAAAGVYEGFIRAVEARDAAKQKELAGTIIERHGRTVFAALAALQVAKLNHESGDFAAARTQLQWVLDKSGHQELAAIARLRLAGVLLDEKSLDAALQLLVGEVPPEHRVAYADRRGDVLLAQDKVEDARRAWREALNFAEAQHPLRAIIQLKLDALPATAAS